jgi:hypothetical protein
MPDPTIRESEEIRRACARKLRAVQVSEHFQAILGCLLNVDWTTPRLVEMAITPDGHLLGRCDGEISLIVFRGAAEDLLQNIPRRREGGGARRRLGGLADGPPLPFDIGTGGYRLA